MILCVLDDIQSQLNKHLLKTVCTDVTNLLFHAVATDQMLSVSDDTVITNEVSNTLLALNQ